MNTGILDDGSLSSRLKGDIYWKKQKLILRAEEATQRENKARAHFYSKFAERGSYDGPGLFEENVHFSESCLSPTQISAYSELIPENYVSQIKNASLKVTVYKREEEFAGLAITGIHSGWLEIVWVALPQDKPDGVHTKELMTHIILNAKEFGGYKGVFAELHMSPEENRMKDILSEIGMDIIEKKNNLYEFRIRDMEKTKTLLDAADRIPCVPLLFLTDREKDEIENMLYNEAGSVPVQMPVPWSSFRQDLSLVHYDSAKKTLGLMLVSQVGDSLVIDLLYGKNPMITAAILGTAIRMASDELPASQKVLVPIVLSATRPIVEKLAPDATREELVEAVFRF
ncbi:MAG: hypothetical protein IKO61_00610 [Lachnospiraceae bacterium]|nr:hypothetical protein [Lachnospiraceae bacterium]